VWPRGSALITDPAWVVLIIAAAPPAAEIEAEMAEAAEELGIVEDAPDAAEGEGGEAGKASSEGGADAAAEKPAE
jgi:large subunit ribosomal protein L25